MSKKKVEEKVAAILTIKRASDMTPKGRWQVAAWLHDQADLLADNGANYSPLFRARYWYNDKAKT